MGALRDHLRVPLIPKRHPRVFGLPPEPGDVHREPFLEGLAQPVRRRQDGRAHLDVVLQRQVVDGVRVRGADGRVFG